MPPKKLTSIPIADTPPLVPLGTLRKLVIRIGSRVDKTEPSSLAQVSPLQQEIAPVGILFYKYFINNIFLRLKLENLLKTAMPSQLAL